MTKENKINTLTQFRSAKTKPHIEEAPGNQVKDWKQYEFIANTSKEFMTLINRNYIYEAANESYCRAHNKTRKDIVGSTVADVWGKERFYTYIKEDLDKSFSGREVRRQSWFEFATVGMRCFEVNYYPHRNDKGAITHVAVVSCDITERKQAEQALQKAHEALDLRMKTQTLELVAANTALKKEVTERKLIEKELRQSEARNRSLIKAIPDLMFWMNADGVYLDFHSNSEDDLYVSPEKFLKKTVDEMLPANIATLIRRHIHKTLGSGTIHVLEYQLPLLQGVQTFEARFVPTASNEVLVIVRNITQQKRDQQQIILADRLAALGRSTSALAHEINNPLQSIQNHLDLLLDFSLNPEEIKEYLNIVRYEITRLSSITQNILNYIHPKPASLQAVNVAEHIQQVLALASNQLERNGIEVTTDLRDVPLALTIQKHLTQVFLNLIMNAIEAIPFNGKLNIALYPEKQHVVISFTNNGPAIPEEVLPHIFDPFFTTKPNGNGLGLWISHNLMLHHGGSLTAENAGDYYGVIFTVKLPSAN